MLSRRDVALPVMSLLFCLIIKGATSLPRQMLSKHDNIYEMKASVSSATLLGPHDPEDKIKILIHVEGENDPEQFLKDLHNPAHPQFLKHLQPSTFGEKFGAKATDIKLVVSTLEAYGIEEISVSPNKLFVSATATAGQLLSAFKAEIMDYNQNGTTFFAPSQTPERPAELKGVAFVIHGLDSVPFARSHAVKAEFVPHGGHGPKGGMSPFDIRTAYNVPTATYNGAGQTIAIATLAPYNVNDAARYATYFGGVGAATDISYVFLGSYTNSKFDEGGAETTLDVSMQLALAPKAKIIVYEADNTGQGFIGLVQRIANDNLASSISLSWGGNEGSSEDASMNTVLKQMAAQGQSFFVASGDSGCYDTNGNGKQYVGIGNPGNSPYATGVGGTYMPKAGAQAMASQVTWTGSGGGVSTVFPIPDYQSGVAGMYSKTKRNTPDVSLNASPSSGYSIFYTDKKGVQSVQVYGGTSAAAPLWAAFGGLVNQCRAAAGKGRIGFLNPILYSLLKDPTTYNAVMTDITSGSNNDGKSGTCYSAGTGYDDATGLGTFNGAPLIDWLCKY